jgi:hypothetical protein
MGTSATAAPAASTTAAADKPCTNIERLNAALPPFANNISLLLPGTFPNPKTGMPVVLTLCQKGNIFLFPGKNPILPQQSTGVLLQH